MRSVKLRKKGVRYYARYYDSERPRGRQRTQRSLRTHRKDVAMSKLAAKREPFLSGLWSPWEDTDATHEPLRLTDAIERFVEAKKGEVQPRTLDTYDGILRRWIGACPAALMLRDVQPKHIKAFVYATKKKRTGQGTVDTNAPIKPATSAKRYRHVRALLSWAEERGHLDRNPLDDVKKPKGDGHVPAYLTPSELDRLLEYIEWHAENVEDCTGRKPDLGWLRDSIVLALSTGLRRGELAALRWESVDLESRKIYVRNRFETGDTFTTKSKGERPVPVRGPSLDVLRRLHVEQGEPESGPVILDRDNLPVKPDRYTKRFKAMVRKAKLRDRKRLRWHSLRHSCGAWLASRGVSARIIQEILGHESSATTEIYSHIAGSAVENAMERVFGNAN